MKKILLLFALLSGLRGLAVANGPYGLPCRDISGNTMDLSAFSGRQLLVVVFSAAAPDTHALALLDSFYRANSSRLAVLAVPMGDFGRTMADSSLGNLLRTGLGVSYRISRTVMAGRSNGNAQDSLMQWLTKASLNGHFDNDAREGQMFLISGNGMLSGVFGKPTPYAVVDGLLAQQQ